MSKLVLAEALGLLSAVESTFNTQPTTGWRTHQPNPDGIQDFYPKIKKVARSPLSKNRQNEKGDIVDLDAEPKLVHDLNKELLDFFGPGVFLSLEKWNGGTATGRFAVTVDVTGAVALSAVAANAYTVASAGALTAGMLMAGRGFTNAVNNGLVVVAAASTATSIKVTGAVLEASPPSNASLEVVGFQGASGDITATTTGLASTALNFTTLGLQVGQWIWVGGGTAASPGALGFTSGGYRGFARITAIAANALTLDRALTAQATDAGAAKTIQIFFGSFIRNVAIDNADYTEPSYNFELSLPGLDSGGATDYIYAYGLYIDNLELNAPAVDKIVATLSFKGTNVTNPATTRATGASSAPTPLASAALNVVTELPRLRVADATAGGNYNANVSVDIDTWKLMVKNNCTAQKQQGTFGPARIIPGKFIVEVDLTSFLVQPDFQLAIRDNRTLMYETCLRNNDCGVLLDLPAATLEDGALKTPANGPCTINGKLMAFRDPTMNFTMGLTKFPYLPAS